MEDLRTTIAAVPPGGYRWWYFDALSEDRRFGFTVIFMIGSVFSPSYARRARRGERAAATDHLGVHVALYADGREVGWAMSEYPASALQASERRLAIGGSSLSWHSDGSVHGIIEERSAPIFWSSLGVGTRLRGTFTLAPERNAEVPAVELGRSDEQRHHWQVLAPVSSMSVAFDRPALAFSGRGYHDSNWGDGRLEHTFRRWSWARVGGARGRVLYAVEPLIGDPRGYSLSLGDGPSEVQGATSSFASAVPTGWGLHTPTQFTVGEHRVDVSTLLDRTPFYARYVATSGDDVGVGEYLDLERFQRPGVQFLLHFRRQNQR